METLALLVRRAAFVVLLIGGAGMLLSMFLSVADVIGSQMLGRPVPGALEITESTMTLIVFGALTYAQIRRSHIRVELLYLRASARMQSAMDIVTDLAALLFFSLLVWQAFNEAVYSWQIGEATFGLIRFPLYPARIVLVLGAGLFILQLLLDLADDVRRFRTGVGGRNVDPAIPEV